MGPNFFKGIRSIGLCFEVVTMGVSGFRIRATLGAYSIYSGSWGSCSFVCAFGSPQHVSSLPVGGGTGQVLTTDDIHPAR